MGPFADRVGFTLVDVTDTSCTGRLPKDGNTQPYGLLHGGANAFLVEHLASILANHLAPEGKVAVGTELQVSHITPADGDVEGRATVGARTGGSIWLDVDITCSGRLTARGRLTCRFVNLPAGAPDPRDVRAKAIERSRPAGRSQGTPRDR